MTNSEGATKSPTRRGWAIPLLLVVVAAVVLTVDQAAKNWVVANLPEGQVVPVLGEALRWYFVRNPGAAFSMASGSTWIFTILACAVVVVILTQLRKLRSLPWAIFLGLLLGGVLGNLTDRLTRAPGFPEGHVIDFISTPWMWLWFPEAIYNIADIAIVSGMLLFVVISFLGLPLDGSPRSKPADASADETADDAVEDSSIPSSEPTSDQDEGSRGAGDSAPEGEHGTP